MTKIKEETKEQVLRQLVEYGYSEVTVTKISSILTKAIEDSKSTAVNPEQGKHLLQRARRSTRGQRALVGKYLKYNKYNTDSVYYLYKENFHTDETTVFKLVEMVTTIHPMNIQKLIWEGGLDAVPAESIKSVVPLDLNDFHELDGSDKTEGLFISADMVTENLKLVEGYVYLNVFRARK